MTHRRNEKHLNLRALNRFKRRQIHKPILLKAYGHLEDNEDAHGLEGAVDVEEVAAIEDADKVVEEEPGTEEDRQHIKAIAAIIMNYLNVTIAVSQVISQKAVLKDDPVKTDVHKINHRTTQTVIDDNKIYKISKIHK